MLKRICNTLMTIIILVLALVSGVLLIPRAMGYQAMAVLSGSMEPELHVGAVAFARQVDPGTLEVGDVISYRIGGDTIVTHRIVAIDETLREITTKGDANDVVDGQPVSFSSVIGRVDFDIPYLGYVSIYIRTPVGIAWGAALLIVLIILGFLPEIFAKQPETKGQEPDEPRQL